jgi:hypothetical protein
MRGAFGVLARATIAMAIAAITAAAPSVAATTAASARVSYLAGGSVYIEAGRLEGLAEGDTLQAVSDGTVVAFLVVRYLSSHRAACDTLKAIAMPAVGDEVWYQGRAVVPRPPSVETAARAAAAGTGSATRTDTASASARRAATPTRKADHVRGRIGARYVVVSPSAGGGYSQPALDLRLDGTNLSGSQLDLAVDVRSRRTYHHTAAGIHDVGEARVYRMSGSLHDAAGHRRLTLGRQISTSLATVNLFDGALIEYAGERFGVGLISGAQPDPVRYALSTRILQHGGYLSMRGRNGARRWSVSTGAIASFDSGQVNRQFMFLQGSYFDPRLALSLAQEMDLNTSWKRTTGVPAVSLTSTFASARAQVTSALSFNVGYDNRRNVRLYRDRVTPETEFDDRYRNGEWVGTSLDLWRHWRITSDARWNRGGVGGSFSSWSASTEIYRLPVLQSDLRWRSTQFSGSLSRGWLHSAGFAVRPWGQTRIELNGGRRTSDDAGGLARTQLSWEGADLDLGLAGRWYLLLSGERNHGDGFDEKQGHISLSWMF